ncbi:ATP-binding protein [Flavobacterium sp.]|uniref:sensor histidine kinase n=1 Tax=Flavobacterium sp. TaxID=239 RepID=UPI0022BA841E|nr:ATP-binding protein [Flavobacterium sp.]MCZ8089821.1 ATP-binding protein [Flavobacterium sp.]
MENQLQFKISAALKNIIGRDLINDDLIAVFELVKNSYDAHASKVDIIFKKNGDSLSKIIIKDNGKGMNYDDLINKWLFVAYSAKKEGTEEDNYRDKIKIKRAYAGAKGIGRFSCDRLGTNLYLETIKDEENSKVEVLITDWEKFEENLNDEFVNISVLHETLEKSTHEDFQNGTILEITNLRNEWDRDKLLKLKSDLAKLINPNTKNSEDSFKINLIVESEKEKDQEVLIKGQKKNSSIESIYKDIVNGEIENLIFETLDLKTTKIVSEVSKKEKNIITTTLIEGGKLVYRLIEENQLENLENVNFTIYYLNQSAKATFSRRMGIPPIEYGHIFVYKNGLRIYPYGERGEDPLKMDNRKTQGTSRYIGTRESIGYIDIYGENQNLTETSSRGDGLIKTSAYNELYSWFYTTLRRLERYIIDVSDWGKDLSDDDYINLDEHSRVIALQELVSKLSKSKNIISIEYGDDLLNLLESKQENSAKSVLSDIKEKINNDNFDKIEILKGIEKAEKKISTLEKIKDDADNAALEEFIKNEKLTNDLEEERKKGSWQGALIGTDKERIIGLQHQIFHSSSRINRNIKLLLKYLNPNDLDENVKKYISVISLEASKINSIANFVTKANFNLKASEIEKDLIEFIIGYIDEIYISESKIIDSQLKINLSLKDDFNFIKEFRPLEITTLIDNFISNSEKAGANSISFVFSKKNSNLIIEVIDNGSKTISIENLNKIFDLGFTTTNGTGIGLFQTKDIINRLNGSITVESEKGKGTKFTITL